MGTAAELARGFWPLILNVAGIPQEVLTKKPKPCPICGGTDRFLFDDKDGKGTFFCRNPQHGPGDGFKLLMEWSGIDFKEAARFVEEVRGGTECQAHRAYVPPAATPEKVSEKERAKLRRWWQESKQIAGSPAETYFRSRGLQLENWPLVLRCHPSHGYYTAPEKEGGSPVHLGNHPTIMALVQAPNGEATTLHRIYLAPNGKGKAELPNPEINKPKKSASKRGSGSAIRLFAPTDELGVAEGIETAIAVTMRLGIPCWSVVCAGGMQSFVPPPGVKRIHIFGDNDAPDSHGRRAGQEAAKGLQKRLQEQGYTARLVLPSRADMDFADIFKAM